MYYETRAFWETASSLFGRTGHGLRKSLCKLSCVIISEMNHKVMFLRERFIKYNIWVPHRLPHIWKVNFELFQNLWGTLCCLQRLHCYPWSSRIRFPWWGSISPWNMYHNYKTFNACSIDTHWQHLTSFKIKTIFLYEFQFLASWTNIEDSLRVIKMIITFPI